MRKTFYYWIVIFSIQFSFSQSIRKDYREFTQQEINDYRDAINILYSNSTMQNLANHHAEHFTSVIHTTGGFNGEQFLTWHRFNLLDFETLLRNSNPNYNYLTIPFWNWTTDQNQSAPKFWHNDFLSLANFPGSGVTRNVGGGGFLGTVTDINNTLALSTHFLNGTIKGSTVADFSHRIEHYHDFVHVWVGGTMNSATSPRDPVFYLHHNYVDNLWQQWEDQNTGNQSSLTLSGQANPIFQYNVPTTSGQVLDSRSIPRPPSAGTGRNMDVWYAKNAKVILDGANGSPFVANDTSVPYLYRYTAATTTGGSIVTGEIYIGDIKYDAANNVIADNKGGFEVNSGVVCNFRAGNAIIFSPGFVAKSGSDMSAKIISLPNSARSFNNDIPIKNFEEELVEIKDLRVKLIIFPNPSTGKFYFKSDYNSNGNIIINDLFENTVLKMNFEDIRNLEIDILDKPKGIYIVKIFFNDEIFTSKIIKE
ncbi:tyrosinase family protein [Flavobacterium sp.]|uniref:tyrosinase family protein n=1 Tax=Flavobacterium sp. TaxID=239 RepID=UPI003752223E